MENFDEEQAIAVRTEDVDRAEVECLITCVRTAKYLEGMRRYYNRNVKGHSFAVGVMKGYPLVVQALLPLGRTLRRQRCYPTRVLSPM